MMTLVQMSLISTIVLSLVFYIFMTYFATLSKKDWYISSADGLIISFLILALLPTFCSVNKELYVNNIVFVYFWGFIIFHIVEKYVRYYTKESWNVDMTIGKLNVILFIIELFSFGFLIVFSAKLFGNFKTEVLLLIVMFISVTSKSFRIDELFEKSIINEKYKKFVVLALFCGGLLAYFISVSHLFSYLLYSFCMGILLYISIRDSMDLKRKVNPVYFLVGTILAIFFIFISMYVFL